MLRLSEASAHLGVSPATLRTYCDRGLVRFREMPNGERRFEQQWLDDFKEQGMKRDRRDDRDHPEERPRHTGVLLASSGLAL